MHRAVDAIPEAFGVSAGGFTLGVRISKGIFRGF
jgi:hypothetical protein